MKLTLVTRILTLGLGLTLGACGGGNSGDGTNDAAAGGAGGAGGAAGATAGDVKVTVHATNADGSEASYTFTKPKKVASGTVFGVNCYVVPDLGGQAPSPRIEANEGNQTLAITWWNFAGVSRQESFSQQKMTLAADLQLIDGMSYASYGVDNGYTKNDFPSCMSTVTVTSTRMAGTLDCTHVLDAKGTAYGNFHVDVDCPLSP